MRNSTVGLVCGAAMLALAASLAWAEKSKSPAVGTAAPDFTAYDYVTGSKTRLSDQHGKVVILTFWATWCSPCRQELPNLEGIQEKLGKDQLVVLAVNFQDSDDTISYLKKSAKKAAWKISMLLDTNGSIAGKYGIDSIPHLFLIGRDGNIAAAHSGFGDGSLDEMLPEINAALAGKPAPATAAE
ncbi:MAG TPA: TlpA disulfide reductase family protein [Steroidobacteraceae bacterium]|jgi:peroxiredoxin